MKHYRITAFFFYISIFSVIGAMGRFNQPMERTSSFSKKTDAATTVKKAPPIELVHGSPLEKEIINLGNEIKVIAENLGESFASKELSQEIEAKKTARDKKQAAKKPGAGYKPGSYKPGYKSPFSTPRTGSSYGGTTPKYTPYKPSYGGSSWGGGGSFGGFASRYPTNTNSSFKPATSSSPQPYSSFGSSSGGSSRQPTSSYDSYDDSTPSKSGGFSRSWNKDNSPEKSVRTKLANQHAMYVDKLEKAISGVTKEENPAIRASKLQNIPIEELNNLFQQTETARQELEKAHLSELEATSEWKTAAAKLNTLKRQLTPLLVELLIPDTSLQIPKATHARKMFEQLNIPGTLSQEEIQALANRRSTTVAQKFRHQAPPGIAPNAKARLAVDLGQIVAQFPADLLGSPIPEILNQVLTQLQP